METLSQTKVDEAAREMLGNLLRAKAFFRRCDVNQLKGFIDAAQQVVEDKEKEAIEEAKRQQEIAKKRAALLDNIHGLCEELGLTYEELLGTDPVKTLRQGNRSAVMNVVKYECTFKGKTYHWKGTGTPPKVFRAAMQEQSVSKAAFLLPEDKQFLHEGRLPIEVPEEDEAEVNRLCELYDKSKANKK
ncbi:H-NS family histone-like protein [Vibrio parahaemolyticus]|uniref:H-NS family histone-like protein n=1 Tax=Vibrio parahaemolyticus TaxID=670 RepID=UPI00301BCC8D